MDLELFAVDIVLGVGEDEAQGIALVDVYTVGLFRRLVMLSRELLFHLRRGGGYGTSGKLKSRNWRQRRR
jgi:hypothetical protein